MAARLRGFAATLASAGPAAHWGAWAASVAVLALATTAGGRLGVAAGSLLVGAVAAAGVSRLRRDAVDGVGLYAAMFGVTFGVLSLVWLADPGLPPPGVGRDDVARALLAVALGLAAFLLGALALGRPRTRGNVRFAPENGPGPVAMAVIFGLAAMVTAVGLMTNAIGYTADPTRDSALLSLTQVFSQAAAIGGLVVLACALQAFAAGDARARRLLPVLAGLQVLIGFAAGFKGQSLMPVVLIVLAYVVSTSRVPWRAIAMTAVCAVILLFPATFAYRGFLEPDNASEDLLKDSELLITSRFRLVDHVALIDARTPDVFARGDGSRYTLLPALVLVPRVLWADKPVLDDGLQFSHTYWEIPGNIVTRTPLTQPGDLLRNFGLPGVVAGLALWGALVAGFVSLCRRFRSPRVEMVYLSSIVTWIIYVESDIPQLVTAATRSLIVSAAVAWLLMPGRSGPPGYRWLAAKATGWAQGLRTAGA